MKLKVLLAGLAGGVAMFLWGFVAHMVLPLGEAGIKILPYQEAVLPGIAAHVIEPGLYLFPSHRRLRGDGSGDCCHDQTPSSSWVPPKSD